MANITKEFLEKALNVKISSFEVNPGSSVGENYNSALYSIDVSLTSSKCNEKYHQEKLHLLLKCFPPNAARQGFLREGNTFWHELKVYDTVIPDIAKFQEEVKPKHFYKLPFAPFFYGLCVDYSKIGKIGESTLKTLCKDSDVLENCIIMAELRKKANGGFKLADRFTGFDLNHCKLVFEAQAKLHGVSWAYKQIMKVSNLNKKYPFMDTNPFEGMGEGMMEQMTKNNIEVFKNVIKDSGELSKEKKEQFLESLARFEKLNYKVAMLHFANKPLENSDLTKDSILRVPRPQKKDEEPWQVLTHGDCWLNNMLFKYDEETGKPLVCTFVDLQLVREGDPFADIAYNFFTSTDAEFRKEHTEELLQLYTKTFLKVCEDFSIDPLPGFNLEEVTRRFQRAKAFGLTMALGCLYIFLAEKEDVADLDTLEGEGVQDILDKLGDISKNMKYSSSFANRVVGIVSELYEEGVI